MSPRSRDVMVPFPDPSQVTDSEPTGCRAGPAERGNLAPRRRVLGSDPCPSLTGFWSFVQAPWGKGDTHTAQGWLDTEFESKGIPRGAQVTLASSLR